MPDDDDPDSPPAAPDPDPDPAFARTVAALGPPDAAFRVSARWLRTRIAVGGGLILLGVGINYLWWVHGPGRRGAVEIHLLAAPPIAGVGLLIHMARNRGLAALVYPTGVMWLKRGEVESYPWDDTTEVRLKADAAGPPVVVQTADGDVIGCVVGVSVPTFQLWKTALFLKRTDGTEVRFTAALSDYPELVRLAQAGTFGVLWPRTLAAVSAGESVAFGEFVADADGLRAGKLSILWADVKEVVVSQKSMSVKRKGKWLPWVVKDLSAVPNPHVLFALARVMTRG